MFFTLSKILFFLIDPLTWLLVLVIWGFFAKSAKRKKRLYITAFILFIVFTNPFLFNQIALQYQPKPIILKENSGYEAGILLGGMSYYDKFDNGFFGENADRFIQTANLYHTRVIKKIIISGGSGKLMVNEPDEASFLAREFIRNGVKKEDIIVERRSRNTYENAVFSKGIIDSLQISGPYVLITSAIHMPRSAAVFKQAGYKDIIKFPCDFSEFEKKLEPRSLYIPEASLFRDWRALIKEWVGLMAYKLSGKA
jgi:uncharacterized SAM-binding protein YcdF (DUF218 family)